MSLLIVGLGNPGNEYRETRHNIGFMVLDHLNDNLGSGWKEKFKGEYSGFPDGYLLKPMTFMNLSGESVQKAAQFFKVKPNMTLVIHDELDLPFGTIALKNGGGLAGHNGLKSIAQHYGTNDFLRLRIGIGRPVHGDVSNYVLSRFGSDDQIILEKVVNGSAEAVKDVINNGFEKVAKKYKKASLIS
ncbi:MAG: PTH1 family peptidyl-tRNA hydrolase [Bacteriovoracaceae bacterium]|jgi:PTH1 family peptidyl-tRNA hydrolase